MLPPDSNSHRVQTSGIPDKLHMNLKTEQFIFLLPNKNISMASLISYWAFLPLFSYIRQDTKITKVPSISVSSEFIYFYLVLSILGFTITVITHMHNLITTASYLCKIAN